MQSSLLNAKLPRDLVAAARSEGVDLEAAWLTVPTDLNLRGNYEEVFLAALPERLVTLGRPADGESVLRLVVDRHDVREIRTRQGIGGGFLEVLLDGVYVEVLAYSNARTDVFHKAAANAA